MTNKYLQNCINAQKQVSLKQNIEFFIFLFVDIDLVVKMNWKWLSFKIISNTIKSEIWDFEFIIVIKQAIFIINIPFKYAPQKDVHYIAAEQRFDWVLWGARFELFNLLLFWEKKYFLH